MSGPVGTAATPDPAALVALGAFYLERQPWFVRVSAGSVAPITLVGFEVLRNGLPGLGRLIVTRDGRQFQLLVGWRAPSDAAGALRGREGALLGPVTLGDTQVLAYDALEDDELALEVLTLASGGAEVAKRVRRVSSLVSHASLVFDERLFMKCYRVLEPGHRPEVEVSFALDRIGFNSLVTPVALWRKDESDLALIREFLPSALEGRLLALTSLRDLLADVSDGDEFTPGQQAASTGGDLAAEMRRLGTMTAGLHLALASAFGEAVPVAGLLEAEQDANGAPVPHDEALSGLHGAALGLVIRLHGDYHLRRVMRTEFGWVVAGFSDDPLYRMARHGPSLSPRVGLPIEDLADMCFSLSLVGHEALLGSSFANDAMAIELVAAWERRNRIAFLDGYAQTPGAERLLPSDPVVTDRLFARYELVRERRYEATSAEG